MNQDSVPDREKLHTTTKQENEEWLTEWLILVK